MNFCSQCATRVAEERKRLKLSQDAAASACGVSREMWGKYERGKAAMGGDVLYLFSRAGADMNYIFTSDREEPPPEVASADERELLALFRAASPAVKSAAIGALRGGSTPRATKRKTIVHGDVGNQMDDNTGNLTINMGDRKK